MKRLFTIAAMVFAVAMTACTDPNENPYDGATDPVFTLSTSSVEIPQAGGAIEIPFTIENPGEWAQLRATTSTSWIKNLAWDQEKSKITFTAPANNSDDPLTNGVITVAYNFKEYNISVTQLGIAYDYRWEVAEDNISLTYYGTDYVEMSNVTISVEAVENEAVIGIADLDVYLPYVNDFCFDIPAGTYNFDAEDTMEAGTVGNEYSYISTDATNEFEELVGFASGSLEVSDNGWVARMFDTNGKSYRIESTTVAHIDEPYPSGITEDLEIPFDSLGTMMMMSTYYGDNYGEGTSLYIVPLMDMNGKVQISLQLVTEDEDMDATTFPTGTFKTGESAEDMSGMGNVAIVSTISQGKIYGSYGTYQGSGFSYLWFKGGDVTISKDEVEAGATQTYTFKFNFTDATHDAHKITGEVSVSCLAMQDATSSAPAAAAANFEAPAYPAKARR